MTRDILLDCMGYNRNDETLSGSVSGGIGSAAGGGGNDDDDEDGGGDEQQQQRAGRPLGICTFLLSLGSRSHNRDMCPLNIGGRLCYSSQSCPLFCGNSVPLE